MSDSEILYIIHFFFGSNNNNTYLCGGRKNTMIRIKYLCTTEKN